MKVTKKVCEMLLTDTNLRLRVALGAGLGENSIIKAAKAALNGTGNSLTKYNTLQAIKTETGLTEAEILEPQTTNA